MIDPRSERLARQIENEERTLNDLQRQVRESKARLDVLIERWEEASAWEDAWEEAVKRDRRVQRAFPA